MIRTVALSAALAAAFAVAGCATPATQKESEFERLSRDCQARGGILVPIGRGDQGNEAANYACEIKGPGGRINQ